jgi:hypothetical protein
MIRHSVKNQQQQFKYREYVHGTYDIRISNNNAQFRPPSFKTFQYQERKIPLCCLSSPMPKPNKLAL